uniref:Guanylate cyclase n=1 Tax=Crassostrea virginica TaxID=6565 RepID=A0A8B8DCV1_CRAVI|nr:atrial natriuretic peptide receptor 1-like [Crassostrea virginica]
MFEWSDVVIYTDFIDNESPAFLRIQGSILWQVFMEAGMRPTLIENYSANPRMSLMKATTVTRVLILLCHNRRLREVLLAAHALGMTNGDFALLYMKTFSPLPSNLWHLPGDNRNEDAKAAYNALLVGMPYKPESVKYVEFEEALKNHSLSKYNYDFDADRTDVNHYVVGYHDAFLIYGEIVREMILEGKNIYDGREFTKRTWNRTYTGLISGNFKINDNGDGEKDFSIHDFDSEGNLHTVGVYFGATAELIMKSNRSIQWPGNKGPPRNRPRCGFTGDDPICFPEESNHVTTIVTTVFCVVILGVVLAGTIAYRRLKLQMDLQGNWWKIPWEVLQTVSEKDSSCNISSKFSLIHLRAENSDDPTKQSRKMNKIFKGSVVSVTPTLTRNFTPARGMLMELLNLRNINCVNLTKFYGLTINNSVLYIITEACSRGTLKDILHNDSCKMNKDLQTSLICDMIKGCCYLHGSSVRFHGNLNSQNCLIDKRFVLKLDGFGLQEIRASAFERDKKQLLYVAPELLRNTYREPNYFVLQSSDVYSFGVIVYEILTRKEPFEDDLQSSSIEDIIGKIKLSTRSPLKLEVEVESEGESSLFAMMYSCLESQADRRPTFAGLSKDSKKNKWGIQGESFLDNLLFRMEEYAYNLERLAEERMHGILDEKRRSEELLYQVLPRTIARDLIRGNTVEAESYQLVTIYFSDIVGFTSISAISTPMQVVDLLNDLYTCFDTVIENFDVYKVETIGDAYMVVSGLPLRNGNEHVVEIAKMSVAILDSVDNFFIRHLPDIKLQARIGIHSGPVCAGVVGSKMPRYCLFGDTVNTASRMESNGEAMKIHVSQTTRDLLILNQSFVLHKRGSMPIKGKGDMTTYWLMAKKNNL